MLEDLDFHADILEFSADFRGEWCLSAGNRTGTRTDDHVLTASLPQLLADVKVIQLFTLMGNFPLRCSISWFCLVLPFTQNQLGQC